MLADFLWGYHRFKSGNNLTILVHQELGEVPADIGIAVGVGFGCFEQVVDLAGIIAVHFYLGEKLEVGVVFRCREFENFFVSARLLCTELVTWESQYPEIVMLTLQSTQSCVLRSEASLTGKIDDQERLIAIVRK